MSVNGECHNAYYLYNITNTVTIVPRRNFTKQTNNFQSIEQRNNSSVEETMETAYDQSKGSCKNLKADWLKTYRTQRCT